MRGAHRNVGYVMDKRHSCIVTRMRGRERLGFIYGGREALMTLTFGPSDIHVH